MTARDEALEILDRMGQRLSFQDRILEKRFNGSPDLTDRDRAFIMNLVKGVLRWRLRLDWIIKQHVKFSFDKIDPTVLNILRLALCQIFFFDRVPQSAAVDEAVKQAKATSRKHVVGFVNGILRHICREKERIPFPDRKNDLVNYLSTFYSYPVWLVEKWTSELGDHSTERLLAAGNRIPRLVIRTNSLKVDRPGLIRCLRQEGIEATPTSFSPEGLTINTLTGPVHRLDSFKKGLFQVQDEPAQIVSHLLSPAPKDRVLDLCSGLGGKSTHLAELIGREGTVFSIDIHHARLLGLIENMNRLRISNIRPVRADASQNIPLLLGQPFEKILVDVPCSALGTISRHPDAKWGRDKNDLKRISLIQLKILEQAAPLLAEGGRMLYVTCTISRDENEEVVRDFLAKNREMTLLDLRNYIPEWGRDLVDKGGFFRTLPHIHDMDGFFGALFSKTGC
ncbi:MAG: 16S rRNA (cytosine(967)-C(5))-methyltransferase RsmB [Thermodesulfobacteriota bacterium]|nr:16S rRNA (cytosine(967)-C(5))-methyltransferase RsmB [Thermodesulfobacteriota bacterium]